MGVLDKIDDGGRVIAGLLGYNPGPGLYSRMSRAVEQMPKVIRTQELPGLLRKYPEGVPGWEVNAVAPALEGVESIPRQDLLDLIQQHSPAYTHREVVLGGNPTVRRKQMWNGLEKTVNVRASRASPLGGHMTHGPALYDEFGQGGDRYAELLLLQPDAPREAFGSHWEQAWAGRSDEAARHAVAHARFDTHGDALRINELQSDLGIHNRKMRESAARHQRMMNGEAPLVIDDADPGTFREQPFPLEDAWADILIKRLALEAARGGHRAIEVASPRAIADKVGGNIDNYEHFYGKVVPGAIERLGRKMGGLTPEGPARASPAQYDVWQESDDLLKDYRRLHRGDPEIIDAFNDLLDAGTPGTSRDAAERLYTLFDDDDPGYATWAVQQAMALADQTNAARSVTRRLLSRGVSPPKPPLAPPGRRYIMSDEMRRRILQQGIGLGVLGPLLGEAGTNSEEN